MESFFVSMLEHLGPIALVLIGSTLVYLVRQFMKKYGIKLDVEIKNLTEVLLIQFVQEGIAYAEQWAKQYVKTHDTAPDGASKMDIALKFISEELKRHGLDNLAERAIRNKIEAILGIETIGNASLNDMLKNAEGEDNNENFLS